MSDQPLGVDSDAADLAFFLAFLKEAWWKLLLASLLGGLAILLLLFLQPNYYRAKAIIAPTGDDSKPSLAVGALASFGIQVGGPSRIEDLESLLKSNDLAARVFARNDLWPAVAGDHYDTVTHQLRPSLAERLLLDKHTGPPTNWDAVRACDDNLKIATNKKAGLLTISFDALSPAASRQIVEIFLDEAKTRLQEEALTRARTNKKFLEGQILQTTDALAKDRLFTLLGQEIEREMMAENREQFGFRAVDSAWDPDRKAGPRRGLGAATAAAFTMFAASYVLFTRKKKAASNQVVPKSASGKQ